MAAPENSNDSQELSLFKQLSKPFPPNCVEWLILNATDIRQGNDFWVYAIASPYIQKESAQNRADEVFGPDKWENDFTMPDKHGRFRYWITYWWNGEQVTKFAGGSLDTDSQGGFNDSDFEIALSYAEKRCWQKIGIGRYLKLIPQQKVRTDMEFQQGWNRYSFKSKWQKDKRGNKKQIKFYWKTPSLPDPALPEEFRGKQEYQEPKGSGKQMIATATEDQWEDIEDYIKHVPEPDAEVIRETVYNQFVDEEGPNPSGEVTYERKKLTKDNAEKVLARLEEKYGMLNKDGIPIEFEDKESTEQKPNPEKSTDGTDDGEGDQEDMFDGKSMAKKTYDAPAPDEK